MIIDLTINQKSNVEIADLKKSYTATIPTASPGVSSTIHNIGVHVLSCTARVRHETSLNTH